MEETMSLFMLVVYVCALSAFAIAVLLVYRVVLSSRETKRISLTPADVLWEQLMLQRALKINHFDSLMKKFVLVCGILIVVIGALWFRRELYGPIILF
jgi:hypothetical protein